eukprot:TRINITY_DN5415_c0_g1_i4.p2 TRINITY_DN5415_c0_g1~~TRINITY_DN5415_c0_g1_i4.p2  ORF type:complete len:134 (+),score=22.36 TRINITY_DN5415_c0_g1_i4:184-585(+)
MCIRDRYQRRVHGSDIHIYFDNIRTLNHPTRSLYGLYKHFVRISIQKVGLAFIFFSKLSRYSFNTANYPRRLPTFSISNQQISFSKAQILQLPLSKFGVVLLSLIHISEPTRPLYISYAVFCLKKKKKPSTEP